MGKKELRASSGRELRTHIGIYGRTNAGKSTLVNTLAGGVVSIVAPEPGTTTDPVRKTIELGELGPCVLVDTAGMGDSTALGEARMRRTLASMYEVDVAVIVVRQAEWGPLEDDLAERLRKAGTPFVVYRSESEEATGLIRKIVSLLKCDKKEERGLFQGLLDQGDVVLLITPIDVSAPKGRMILPQVQAIRAAIDLGAMPIVCKPSEIAKALAALRQPPRLVVTDSQVFAEAGKLVPDSIPFTSFSMLLARQKGEYQAYEEGLRHIESLRPGDRVLVLEGCTHQVTCEDIGRVKIPRWLEQHVGGQLRFEFINGVGGLPTDMDGYAFALVCGGCMLTARQIRGRVHPIQNAGIPVVNYGMAIAYLQGIYRRAQRAFS